jgi:hypothetical protein
MQEEGVLPATDCCRGTSSESWCSWTSTPSSWDPPTDACSLKRRFSSINRLIAALVGRALREDPAKMHSWS